MKKAILIEEVECLEGVNIYREKNDPDKIYDFIMLIPILSNVVWLCHLLFRDKRFREK